MTKLDEIEAKLDRTVWTVPAAMTRSEVELLIKAARRLGKEFSTNHKRCDDDCLAKRRVGSDVLELLEAANGRP